MLQGNLQFSRKNAIFRNFGPLVGAEDINIFKNFSIFFDPIPLGNFWLLLLFEFLIFGFFTPPYYTYRYAITYTSQLYIRTGCTIRRKEKQRQTKTALDYI